MTARNRLFIHSFIVLFSLTLLSYIYIKMQRSFNQRASRRPVNMDPPTNPGKFISPDSRKLYRNVCVDPEVVKGCIIQPAQEVCYHFTLLYRFGLNVFLDTEEDVFEEVVRHFYAALTIPEVPKGTKPMFRSHLLRTFIEFSLSTLCEILNLPNEEDLVYHSAYDKLLAFGKFELEFYSLILVMVKNQHCHSPKA